MDVVIGLDDPRKADVRTLLGAHRAFSQAATPPEYAFALDGDRLLEPAVRLFAAREAGELIGVAAITRLDDEHAELKSMHVRDVKRSRGVGRAMVEHILGFASKQGYRRESLETGTTEAFAPARALYASLGFERSDPFGAYPQSPYNAYMTMSLEAWRSRAKTPEAPRPPVDSQIGVATYRDAAQDLVGVGAQFGGNDWPNPPGCVGWDATALAGHVLCVVRWHHEWLDRAEAGAASPPWPVGELSVRNEAELEGLEIATGPQRLEAFGAEARRYAERLSYTWELPLWYPGGLTTVGMHAVLAAGEWHLHAWDLGRAIGVDHSPDATVIRAGWLALARPIAADGDPWAALLGASGRCPPR